MGSQNPTSNDRSRTYWTPTMERYFIDLMLEHMNRGNRTGHTFNKQAWTDMLAFFNAKFSSQYDKDVLKSRYTSLWKQFNDIKNLLGQIGFSWDDTRQMVVADDYVWDAYLKVHPDARPYKTKAVLNFNDLCLIYGYTTADGRYSRSSHDIDVDDDVQGRNSGEGIATVVPSSSDRSRTDWTPVMDRYFIELMLNQQERGNKLDTTFSKQAWTDMLTLFNEKFGPQHSKRVLRHRYKKLWKYYSDVTFLLKQNGFSWDESQQMIAADDDVWDTYVKAHPHARSYRTRMLPNYKDLGFIFRDATNGGIQSDPYQDKELDDDILGIKAGSERSRTYWTPPMDRCLIDLLLDQVHKGNKIGQTFITQAWNNVVTLFNTKFKSQYDRDVLKNRYKHLRRQYNDVKTLLEQDGFSWDETREMVTAADHVWDAYIMAHPDARSYRVKTVPSYPKLCVIYGQDCPNGRYTRLACNVDPDSAVPLLVIEEGREAQSPASVYPVMDWTPLMDRHFIDLMLEQVHRGNGIECTFDDQVWAYMNTSFHEKFGVQCDKYVLENRYMCLMKQYSDIRGLLNQSGFAWDESQQMVLADEAIWEAYIKDNPDAITYKNKIVGYYDDLCILFGSEMMDVGFSCQSIGTEIDFKALEIGMDEVSGCLQIEIMDLDTSNQGMKRPGTMPSPGGRSSKVQKTGGEIEEPSPDIAKVVTKLVNNQDKSYISIENAIDALQAIPDIDDELLLDACDLLEDERKAKTFLALDINLRKKWLLRKLGR
ncbi:L10-interacting MYB domain-containing protein [Actinidia chinensis var. chinensis]|uniref:L10-interacting MYB domain-containing protein n=1 Tax=Actinidia chinensis var. chinensis TaxID=1590841 RepID=A0A2R6PJ33_ACTCC|nr:L10-interacting MYB domain-containing protein [Actinidia chinensis var. chinensis]